MCHSWYLTGDKLLSVLQTYGLVKTEEKCAPKRHFETQGVNLQKKRPIWHGHSRTQSILALRSLVKLLRVWPADKWTSRVTAFILNYLFANIVSVQPRENHYPCSHHPTCLSQISVFQTPTFLLWGKKYKHLDYCTDCKGNYFARTDPLRTAFFIAPKSSYPESLWNKDVVQQLRIKGDDMPLGVSL